MKKIKVTYSRLVEIITNIKAVSAKEKDKLSYAVTRLAEGNKTAIGEYNDLIEDAKINNAQVDDKGSLILNASGGYTYSKESMRALTKEIAEINKKEVEFSYYKCLDNTRVEELPIDVIYALNGVLFDYDLSEFESEEAVTNGAIREGVEL